MDREQSEGRPGPGLAGPRPRGAARPAAPVSVDPVRLRPGVLGNAASTEEESFSEGLLEHPQYTRPPVWEGREIPPVLLSGNHAEIARWRRAEAERITRERRPDLWAARDTGA